MSQVESTSDLHQTDIVPGDQRLPRLEIIEAIKLYLVGLGLATLLTFVSFFVSGTTLVWGPSIPVALVVLAIAQMGVHLVFFFHITTGPDSVNNVLALAFGVLIVFLVLVGSLWIMANLNRNLAYSGETMQMPPEAGPGFRTVTASGVVAPTATTPVRARVSGAIQSVYCDANIQVKAGQVCAKIDPRPYQIVVDQSKADLQASEARLEKDKATLALMKAALEHQEARAKRRAISRKALDKSRKSFETAKAENARDEAKAAEHAEALHAAETSLGSTEIVSPLDGTVLSRNVESGQTIAAGSETPLFVIAGELSVVHIDATIRTKDIGEVKLGHKATFTVEAFPNRPFSGAVTQIRRSPQTYKHVATYDVVVTAPNPDLLLKPGMPATIRIAIE